MHFWATWNSNPGDFFPVSSSTSTRRWRLANSPHFFKFFFLPFHLHSIVPLPSAIATMKCLTSVRLTCSSTATPIAGSARPPSKLPLSAGTCPRWHQTILSNLKHWQEIEGKCHLSPGLRAEMLQEGTCEAVLPVDDEVTYASDEEELLQGWNSG